MFGFLELLPKEEGRRARRRERRTLPRPVVTCYSGAGRSAVYRISVRQRQDGQEFSRLTAYIDPLRSRLLAGEGMLLPQEVEPYLFRPQWYPHVLLAETALGVLADLPGDRFERTIGILDREGHFLPHVERFVPLANRFEVLSERTDRYGQIAEQLYHTYGAVLTCDRENLRALSADFIIACGMDTRLSLIRRPFLTDIHTPAANALQIESVRLYGNPPVPAGIDSLLFSAALAECNGVSDGGGAKVGSFTFRGKTISRAAALELLTIPSFF